MEESPGTKTGHSYGHNLEGAGGFAGEGETLKLEYAKYVIRFTTFSSKTFPAQEVLPWDRIRWQVERGFKRLKSLAQLGHLPKYDTDKIS